MFMSRRNPRSAFNFCLEISPSVVSLFCVTVSFMPLYYGVPHLCLQYSTHGNQDFDSIYMSLYLYVRKTKTVRKKRKRETMQCATSLFKQNRVYLQRMMFLCSHSHPNKLLFSQSFIMAFFVAMDSLLYLYIWTLERQWDPISTNSGIINCHKT